MQLQINVYNVVTVAVVLEIHACVGRDQHASILLAIPRPHEASAHICALVYTISTSIVLCVLVHK